MTATCHQCIWILTPSPLSQGVAGGVENHPLLRLSPKPLPPHINAHALIHTLHTLYLPLPLPPPHDLPYFCAIMNSLLIILHELQQPEQDNWYLGEASNKEKQQQQQYFVLWSTL